MPVEIEQVEHIRVIRIRADRLNCSTLPQIGPALKSALATPALCAIDLSEVAYADCLGIEFLLDCLRRSTGEIVSIGTDTSWRQMFELLHLHQVLTLYNSLDELLEKTRRV